MNIQGGKKSLFDLLEDLDAAACGSLQGRFFMVLMFFFWLFWLAHAAQLKV